jgi:hypothetical protein
MKITLYWLAASLVLLASASGQVAPNIHGIKIKSQSFDPQTSYAKLAFINDSSADITAYHYCVNIYSFAPGVSRSQCYWVESLLSVLDQKAELRERPWLNVTLGGDGTNFIHPGETYEESHPIGYRGVFDGRFTIDFVAYSDGTFEGDQGLLKVLVAKRTTELQYYQFIAQRVASVLATSDKQTLVSSAIDTLEQQKALLDLQSEDGKIWQTGLSHAIDELRRPEMRKTAEASYITPADQRGFLQKYLDRHAFMARELAKQASLRKAGGQ